MTTASCSSKVGPGGDSYDQDGNEDGCGNMDLQVIKVVKNLVDRPYDDMIFKWCDGDASRDFSEVKIDFKKRKDGPNIGVRLGDLYDTSIFEKYNVMTEYTALLDFLKDSDKDAEAMSRVFRRKPNGPSKTEIVVTLAVHLFAKLAPKSTVLVGKNIQDRPSVCPCGCGGTYSVAHLGFGSGEVWHGRPDLEVGSVVVIVLAHDDLEDEISKQSDGLSPPKKQKEESTLGISVECKKGSISAMDVLCQTAAQVITNSYAQVAVNKRLAEKFIPAILCSPEGVRMFIYNKTHDFLLYTHKKLDLLEDEPGEVVKLNIPAALEIWLAIHIHLVGCNAGRFSKSDSEHKGPTCMSKCGFKEMMEQRNALRFYETAKPSKDFEEKKLTHFDDLQSPYGRLIVEPACR